ncbi:serine/threonine protein kinase [Tumidithrix helvetica PCC 7403]|uniref:serine/threonine protein kinase n=1 Tax=Tumidithrix helvetica TaxID=3457545 RepID=UPI003CB6CFF6
MMSTLLDNRYRVLQVLGGGGFGETFLAEDTKMPSNRHCVIKQLKPIADDPKMYKLLQDRFQREAAILEDLGELHPYIPKLYASFTENGKFYLVQEWIDGQTLTAKLKSEGELDEATVKTILASILQILDYVHGKGIIHRDIKPDNIILRASDRHPVLIDFGAVKETVSTGLNPKQVVSSIIIGTPGFMASEQAAGRPFFASDIYSLGLTAIYMLTGKLPQELGTDTHTGEVCWHEYASQVSLGLKATIDRAIQFHPRDRFTSAKEMLSALQSDDRTAMMAASTLPTVAIAAHQGNRIPSQLPDSEAQKQFYRTSVEGNGDTLVPTLGRRLSAKRSGIATFLVILSIGMLGTLGFFIAKNVKFNLGQNIGAGTPSPTESVPSNPQLPSFYFLADSAFQEKARAESQVKSLRDEGYNQANSFLLTDYPNLGDKKFFQVYIDRFDNIDRCIAQLKIYGQKKPDVYCAFASKDANASIQRVTAADVIPKPKPTAVAGISPEQGVRDYYGLINERKYDLAWKRLSPKFQVNTAKGNDSFLDWWKQIDKVSIDKIRLVNQTSNSAIVDADLAYYKKSGVFPETLRITMTWDEPTNTWIFTETKPR